jgi:DNA-binding XRE family transcriptional regulator
MAGAQLSFAQRKRLADRIRAFAQERGIAGDRGLAAAAGLGEGWRLGSIEKGATGPSLGLLLALCRALGVYSLDQLLGFSATTFFDGVDAVESALAGMTDILYREIDDPSPVMVTSRGRPCD